MDHEPPERKLSCDQCGGEGFDEGDDGFYYCPQCGTRSQDMVATATAEEDIGLASTGALYTPFLNRAKVRDPSERKTDLPTHEQILKGLGQSSAGCTVLPGFNVDDVPELRDFRCDDLPHIDIDAEEIGATTRLRYIEGLQLMLQLQCKALVEEFGVSPLIFSFAGTIWLRHVAASGVFGNGWIETAMIAYNKARSGGDSTFLRSKKRKALRRKNPPWPFLLKKAIPLSTTIVVSFLACYLAREAITTTDIAVWAMEGKIPYLSAFVDIGKIIGKCPSGSSTLRRPQHPVYPCKVESSAGCIARNLGLRLPPVNFYAIACRYLRELSLPCDKIIPHAMRLYEWSMPAELWLSSTVHCLPTHVCVMSILIVTLRILYGLHGYGIWESCFRDWRCASENGKNHEPELKNISHLRKKTRKTKEIAKPFVDDAAYFCAKELMAIVENQYDRLVTRDDFTKDLQAYLDYCKNQIFPDMPSTFEETSVIDKFWNAYTSKDDERFGDGIRTEPSQAGKKRRGGDCAEATAAATISSNTTLDELKADMEENEFQYLPPRDLARSGDYLRYIRMVEGGKLVFVAHAEYYVLLRALGAISRTDLRLLHIGALEFEKRLAWIEVRISGSMRRLLPSGSPSDEKP